MRKRRMEYKERKEGRQGMRKRRMEYKERKEGRIDGKLAPKGHKRRPFQVTEQSTSNTLNTKGYKPKLDMQQLATICRAVGDG